MASSSEFDLLVTIGITIFAALGFSILFSKLKQPLYPLAGLATLASFLSASLGLHLHRPQSMAQLAELLPRSIETPLDPKGLIPTQIDGGLV